MNRLAFTVLYVLACVACVTLVACVANPGKDAARAALIDEITKTIVDSGALVTAEQVEAIDARLDAYEAEPEGVLPDWAETAATIGGALLGVKVLPTRLFQGPFDRPAAA